MSLETRHEFCRDQNTCSEEQRRESKEKTEGCKNVYGIKPGMGELSFEQPK